MLRGIPKAVEALAKTGPDDESSTYEKRLEQAKQEADMAQKEVDNGFPLLHAQAVVSLWGSLESLMSTFLARWLANEPKAILMNQVQKLKVQLGDYESLDREERSYYILDLLERDLQSPLKQGVSRFELPLEIFGLGGQVDRNVNKKLFEMGQIRNVIVHRRGIVDRKLKSACPWLKTTIGKSIVINHHDYKQYSYAAISYVTELIVRVAVYFGQSRDEFKETLDNLQDGNRMLFDS